MSHPSIKQPSSGNKVRSVSTRSKMKQQLNCVGPHADVDTLECPKTPGERWCWENYLVIPNFRAAKFLMHLAVTMVGLGMNFATMPAVQASSCEAQSDHLRQPQSHLRLDFLHGYRNIDPEIYLPLNKSLDVFGDLPIPSTETLAQHIQTRHASAQLLAAFANHDLPCALRGLATGDEDARLRLVLSHGHKLGTYDRTSSATLKHWYDASYPYYHRALKDAETARDKARMSWYQSAIRKHQPIPFFLAYEGAWRTQNRAQLWFDEVSSIFANHEADRETLIADRDRNENLATELFKLRISLDKDTPGPWNRTDALALKRWYFHKIVGFGDRNLEWASFEAEFDGLECDPV